MKKIRINELARELEVKAHEILDRLPELGVTEKKTHSSSIDEDVAIKLRRLYGAYKREEAEGEGEPAKESAAQTETMETAEAPAAPAVHAHIETAGHEAPAPEAVAPTAMEELKAIPGSAAPIRPPLAPGRPIHPPVAGAGAGTTVPRLEGPRAMPAPAPPAAVIAPGRPAMPAVKPLPGPPTSAPRPGQILSGPRQPFPTTAAEGTRVSGPGAAMPGMAASPALAGRPRLAGMAGPGGPASAPAPAAATTGSMPLTAGRTLVGQPAARPVVPPRADLAAKLGTTRPAMPAPPASPRPGVPRQPSSPVPGQPIYRGPIRPGQPMVAKTGARPATPGIRPAGPRPQHPTSRGRMEPGLAPPPMEQPRGRPGDKRPSRPQPRERQEQERMLRPARRQVEAGPPPINREITISEGITVKELCEKLDVKAALVMKKLMDRSIFATINQTLDSKLA